MIKKLFLPEQIGNYYLFAKRIVGFDIGKTHVRACQIYLKGTTIEIEKYIEEKLEPATGALWQERATQAIATILSQLDPYDQLNCALSSSMAIFKELRLPFLTEDKIKMVVNYEIEPLLPFPLHDTAIDFIITKTQPEQSSSQVLVAAVQNQYIAQHIQLFADAQATVNVITIDMIALYGLYKNVPTYAQIQGGVALIDLGLQSTRIAYIQDGQLRFIRTIAKGIYTIAKTIGDKLNMQPTEAMELVLRYGLEISNNQTYAQTIKDAFNAYWHDIQFTLQSFSAQSGSENLLQKIFVLGSGAEVKGITNFVHSYLHVDCQQMHVTDLLYNTAITIKNKITLPSSSIVSLSCAVPSPITKDFNLRQHELAQSPGNLITNQLLVALALALCIFAGIVTNSYWQIRKLRNAAYSMQEEAFQELLERKHFRGPIEENLGDVKEQDQLEEALAIAQNELKKQEDMWFAFAGNARASFLKYLLELTNKIDKQALGFELESLSISDHVMTIKARVKDHEALKLLEKELRSSKLFTSITSPEETTFTMTIGLAKSPEES